MVFGYACDLSLSRILTAFVVTLDATTGATLRVAEQVERGWVNEMGAGYSLWDGIVELQLERDEAPSDPAKTFRLWGIDFQSFDRRAEEFPLGEPIVPIDPNDEAMQFFDDDGVYADADQELAVDFHWALAAAAAMGRQRFGLACTDPEWNNGHLGMSVVHIPDHLYGTTTFNYLTTEFTVPEGLAGWGLDTAIEVAGHEYGHCLQRRAATQVVIGAYPEQDHAIAEGWADVVGLLAYASLHGEPRWTLLFSNGGLGSPHWYWKDFADPHLANPPLPKFYRGEHWQYPGRNDLGSTHRNGALLGHWLYLLSTGVEGVNEAGQPYRVPKLGLDTAARLLWRGIGERPAPTFPAVRESTVAGAKEVCGDFSLERQAAHAAWQAVGLYHQAAPASDFWSRPAHDATEVEPWPVELLWQPGARETRWRLQVATDPDFDVVVVDKTITETVQQPGIGTVARASGNLDAGREYWWRVRPVDARFATDLACWRPVRSFRTAEKKVTAISPYWNVDADPFHPWDLPFLWEAHPQAARYVVEVATAPTFAADELLFPARLTGHTTMMLDVLVERTLWWRVRPIAANGSLGTWSDPERFDTTMPEVTIVSPAVGEPVFPWPVEVEWEPVEGADHYLIEALPLTMTHGGSNQLWEPGNPAYQWMEVPGTVTTAEFYMHADLPPQLYAWKVRVIGPKPLGSIDAFPEEGLPGVASFFLDTQKTVPQPIEPASPSCPAGATPGSTTLRWSEVPGASSYQVLGAPFDLLGGGAAEMPPESNAYLWATHSQQGTQTSLAFDPADFGHLQLYEGAVWRVEANGPILFPDDPPLRGYRPAWDPAHMARFLFQPVAPTPTFPIGPIDFEPWIFFTWSGSYTHDNTYVVEKFHSSDCSGAPYWTRSESVSSNVATTGEILRFPGVGEFSWRVRAEALPAPGGQQVCPPAVSACIPYSVAFSGGGEQGPPAPDVPTEGCWDPDQWACPALDPNAVHLLFENVLGADAYVAEVRTGTQDGPLFADDAWSTIELQALLEDFEAACGVPLPDPPINWVVMLPGAAPGQTYWYRVSACSGGDGCGEWSSWSRYDTTCP
jgi:hypothetical protein